MLYNVTGKNCHMAGETVFIIADHPALQQGYGDVISLLGYQIVGNTNPSEVTREMLSRLTAPPDALFFHEGIEGAFGYIGMAPQHVVALWRDQFPDVPVLEIGLDRLGIGNVFIPEYPDIGTIANALHGVFAHAEA